MTIVRPDVDVWGWVGVCFNGKEQFEQSCVFRGYIVALTTTKVPRNIRAIDEGTRNHPMIRG